MGTTFDVVVRIANRQHGRVACRQLLAAGVARHQIQRWHRAGVLHRVHAGVCAVGHTAPSTDAAYMAAVLACGDDAILTQRAAACKMGLIRGGAPRPQVTVPRTNGRRRRWIVIHRVSDLHPRDHAIVDAIPIATVPRILYDLAPLLSPSRLTQACHEAWVRHDTTPDRVAASIERAPRRPGAEKLRRALGGAVLLSELERAFRRLMRSHGLPLPRTNVDHVGDKVDCRPETAAEIRARLGL